MTLECDKRLMDRILQRQIPILQPAAVEHVPRFTVSDKLIEMTGFCEGGLDLGHGGWEGPLFNRGACGRRTLFEVQPAKLTLRITMLANCPWNLGTIDSSVLPNWYNASCSYILSARKYPPIRLFCYIRHKLPEAVRGCADTWLKPATVQESVENL